VAELATQHFIKDDKPNVTGLVLAGSANFKNDLNQSDMFDKRLLNIVVKIVDVSYGGENGFNQAITLSADSLLNVKFVAEKKLLSKFFEDIALDTGMVVFGVEDTIKTLELGAIETIVLFEELEVNRYHIRNPAKGESRYYNLTKYQEKDKKYFIDAETGSDLEVVEVTPFAEWLCENY